MDEERAKLAAKLVELGWTPEPHPSMKLGLPARIWTSPTCNKTDFVSAVRQAINPTYSPKETTMDEMKMSSMKIELGSVWQDLLKKFGPLIAELILQWLINNTPKMAEFEAGKMKAGLPGDFVRHFVGQMLRDHKSEILNFVDQQMWLAYDKVVDVIDPPPIAPAASAEKT